MTKKDGLSTENNPNSVSTNFDADVEKLRSGGFGENALNKPNGDPKDSENTPNNKNNFSSNGKVSIKLSDENNPILSSPNSNDDFSKAKAKFGEELAGRERNRYKEDITEITTTDDLMDDNDALTERSEYNAHRKNGGIA